MSSASSKSSLLVIFSVNNLLIKLLSESPCSKDFKTISLVISPLKSSKDSIMKSTIVAFALGNFPLKALNKSWFTLNKS